MCAKGDCRCCSLVSEVNGTWELFVDVHPGFTSFVCGLCLHLFPESSVKLHQCSPKPQTGPWYWYQEDNPGFQFLKSGFIPVFHQLPARFHPSPLSSSWYTYRRLWGIHSPAPLPPHWNEVYEWGGRGGEEGKCEDRKRKKRKDWKKEGNRGTR